MTADKADKQCNYVCPGCQTPVTVKKGRLKQAHFAHTSL
ncbi:MAG: competence protein CoiA family protein, partial [Weissella cibaria]